MYLIFFFIATDSANDISQVRKSSTFNHSRNEPTRQPMFMALMGEGETSVLVAISWFPSNEIVKCLGNGFTLLLHKQHDGKCGKTRIAMFSGIFDVNPGYHQR